MSEKIRIAYIDSELLFRESLVQNLKTLAPFIELTFEGANLADLKIFIQENAEREPMAWDLLLVRMDDHRTDPNLMVRTLIDLQPETPVLILTRPQTEGFILSALRDGIKGFVSTSCPTSELLDAMDKVLKGQKYFSPEITESFVEPELIPSEDPVKKLSKRELQVVVGLLEGLQNCQIAEQLKISSKTVSSYKARVFEKLRVDTNAELFKFAHKTNLISRLV